MSERIIEYLRNRNDFVPGEEISRSLGITRAAIWKKVKNLRKEGYLIEAVPSKGYKLRPSPDTLTEKEIRTVFEGNIIGREIIFYEETGSTNERALKIGGLSRQGKGILEGTVIIADAQSRGRGRFGRHWVSPPHVNLYFTVLLEPPFSPGEASILTLMAAVAVVSAIREYVGLNAVIKWPNDILIRNKKVGGILTEMKSDIDRINFVAVGIGVNVNMSLNMLPGDMRLFTTSLKEEKGEPIRRVELLGVILAKFEYWYKTLLQGRRRALINEWRRLDSTTGNRIRVKTNDRIISGLAKGISDDGRLIIKLLSGAEKKVYAGEVTILKKIKNLNSGRKKYSK